MRRTLALFVILFAVAGCSHTDGEPVKPVLKPVDYQWHKETRWLRLHWNYIKNPDGTITAHGFVEPESPGKGVHDVKLRLVGLDGSGNIVSEADGSPEDAYISMRNRQSEFTITIKPSGRERRYTITGYYYHFLAGTHPDFSRENRDELSLGPPR